MCFYFERIMCDTAEVKYLTFEFILNNIMGIFDEKNTKIFYLYPSIDYEILLFDVSRQVQMLYNSSWFLVNGFFIELGYQIKA